ncbi:MAG TPA: GtrA family protein [Nocardioides sp.]|jgi:putative flippase GtrA|nr:GtrA family protein [Nocardioides sp.]
MPASPDSSVAPATQERLGLAPKLLRYFTGSVVATVCSEVTFVVLYGLLDVGTTWSSVLAWLAGAVPNFWLNRSWAWQRTGRPSLRREVLPYAVIIVATLLLATLMTHAADVWLHHQGVSSSVRVVVVATVFLGTYVVVFALRFLLLERLFTRLHLHETAEGRR